MRTIKFRGKRVDNGEWVCGDLVHITTKEGVKGTLIIHETQVVGETTSEEADLSYSRNEFSVVIPDTVGQFTGLLDKHGEEIYEWDIVRTLSGFVGYMRYNERFIRFEVAAPSESYDNDRNPDGVPRESWVVIGNIHDNPELLKR